MALASHCEKVLVLVFTVWSLYVLHVHVGVFSGFPPQSKNVFYGFIGVSECVCPPVVSSIWDRLQHPQSAEVLGREAETSLTASDVYLI